MNSFIKGVLASIIAAALIAAGSWLASTQVPEETALRFTVNAFNVGELSVWHVTLLNATDHAFDKLRFSPPTNGLLNASFEPKTPNNNPKLPSSWEGILQKDDFVYALLIFDPNAAFYSDELLEKSIYVRYQVRDKESGILTWTKVPIQKGATSSVLRMSEVIGWFLAPFAGSGLIVFGVYILLSRATKRRNRHKRKTESKAKKTIPVTPKSAPKEDDPVNS